MSVITVLLFFVASVVLLIMKWWFSVSGQLYRDKSIPVPSGETLVQFDSNFWEQQIILSMHLLFSYLIRIHHL